MPARSGACGEQLDMRTGPHSLDQAIHRLRLAAVLAHRFDEQIALILRQLLWLAACGDQEELGSAAQYEAGTECPGLAGRGLFRPRAHGLWLEAPGLCDAVGQPELRLVPQRISTQ